MSLPMSVTSDQLQTVWITSGHCSASEIFTGLMSRGFWEPVLVWSASLFKEENGLFFLAATRYKQAPTKQKMDYIYRHFIANGKKEVPRSINIPNPARVRTFELVTGAQTKHFHGGCRLDAFEHAVAGLTDVVRNGIDHEFNTARKRPDGTTFKMLANQNMMLNKELDELARLGIQL